MQARIRPSTSSGQSSGQSSGTPYVIITRGLHNALPGAGCVLTIGNFDGVHLGHRALLERAVAVGRERRLPAALLTFEPHPVEVLAPERAPARLTRFREKMVALRGVPVERVVCARFDRSLAAMSPGAFIDAVLCQRLGVRHLIVGDDFRFGRGGAGDFDTLRAAERAGRFALSRVATVILGAGRVSSTRVRELLDAGELDAAAALLGRRFSLCGRVARGQGIGRTLGFPTANVPIARNRAPLAGVFAVRLHGTRGQVFEGVANVGRRPTVGGDAVRVEVHLLDFSGDLYGTELRVEFLARLRPEQRFEGLDALKAQIAHDVAAARRMHAVAGRAGPGRHG